MSLETLSTWLAHRTHKKPYPKLSSALSADVCVVGGGITGILSAYMLAKIGKNVVLLEKNEIGSGATGRTTGFLTESLDTDFRDLIRSFGLNNARAIVGAHQDAIHMVEKIVREERIDCEFTHTSNYIYANRSEQVAGLQEECSAAQQLGVAAEFHAHDTSSGFKNAGELELKHQAMFHAIKFIDALADVAEKAGVRIFENTEVTDMHVEKGVVVVSAGHTVTASWAISAVYEPFAEPLLIYFKKAMYRTYVCELSVTGTLLREGLYEDTGNPYHYFRVENNHNNETGQRVIFGGEDHRADLPVDEAKNFNALKKYIDVIIPPAHYSVQRMWKGGILEPLDGLALIGRLNDDPILYASAFSGSGMTYAPIAARILTDCIIGKKDILHEIFAPSRLPRLHALILKTRDYVQEFVDGAIKNTFSETKQLDPKFTNKKKPL